MSKITFIGGGNMAGKDADTIVLAVKPQIIPMVADQIKASADTNDKTNDAQRAEAVKIIEAFGICVTVEREELLDAVTAVSGSGPAYYFLMIEEMVKSGIKLGLSPEDATALTLQTALGAANMAAQRDAEPTELRRRVTSPKGTTHAAIESMQESGYGDIIETAMTACRDRAVELGKG